MDVGLDLRDLDYIFQTAAFAEQELVGNVRQKDMAAERKNGAGKSGRPTSCECTHV